MPWLNALLQSPSVAGTIIVLGAVCAVGLALGAVRVKGVGLGVAGVLFAGLGAANLAFKPDDAALGFVRDFGLILFVFGIGLQIGPGFLASLRRGGIRLNALAAGVVAAGVALAWVVGTFAHVPGAAAVGLLAGATTNTPSLAAAQAALADRTAEGGIAAQVSLATTGYALAYPGGVVGTILAMVLARAFLKFPGAPVVPGVPAAARERVAQINLLVTNSSLNGVPLSRLPIINEAPRAGGGENEGTVVVTRHLVGDTLGVPTADTLLHTGDMLLAVGPAERLDQLRMLVGCLSPIDLREYPSEIMSQRLVVTRREVLGRTLADLDITARYGVTISRVGRAGVEITPWPGLSFNYADAVLAVGPADNVKQVAALLGNRPKALDHPQLIPIFLGIALGAVVGSVPLAVPGLPGPVKLGLAGGPLLVAIVLSRVGRIGPMICYLPLSANFALREVGISLFLACVGLTSGAAFAQAAFSWHGLAWLAMGAGVTLLPLLLGAVVGRAWLKLDYGSLCGVLAGSMTDPPALAYANSMAGSDAPAMAYTTVYPLTMLLRVFCAQVLVEILVR